MKKTMIALVALASVACAADVSDAVATLTSSAPTVSGTYNTANMYIVAALDLDAAKTLTSSTNDVIVAMTLAGKSDVSRIAAGVKVNQFKFTTHEIGGEIGGQMWTPQAYPANSAVTDIVTALNSEANAVAATLSLAYSTTANTGSSMYVSIMFEDGTIRDYSYQHTGVLWSGTTVNGAEIDTTYVTSAYLFNNGTSVWTADGVKATAHNVLTSLATPEPATATLSLLALAGLAARRRRH